MIGSNFESTYQVVFKTALYDSPVGRYFQWPYDARKYMESLPYKTATLEWAEYRVGGVAVEGIRRKGCRSEKEIEELAQRQKLWEDYGCD